MKVLPRLAFVLLLAPGGCTDPEKLPVIARGKYVELATDRDEHVCAGAVAFMDAYVEAVAALLGESLPDRVFVRYEWTGVEHGVTRGDQALRIVEDSRIANEHALVHAVHRELWPASRPFLHEGLAVLMDNRGFDRARWPEGKLLDPLLEADSADELAYYDAWFVVSQIVADHGFAGLRELWFAVPSDASATEIRDSYEAIFHEPIEAIFQPIVMYPGTGAEYESPRATCAFDPCVGEPMPWDGESWSGVAPNGCEDDETGVGPSAGPSRELGDVWRSYVIETDASELRATAAGSVGIVFRACPLRCDPFFDNNAYGGVGPVDGSHTLSIGPSGRFRVELARDSDNLPTDLAGVVTLRPEP